MKEALFSTLLHTLELVVVLAAVWTMKNLLGLEVPSEALAVVLAALAKFGRTASGKDYVNQK